MNYSLILNNQFVFYATLLLISVLNIFLNSHYFTFMFIGILFIMLLDKIDKKQAYGIIATSICLGIVEVLYGFKLFSTTLFAFFVYVFLYEYIVNIFTLKYMQYMISATLVYAFTLLSFWFSNGFDFSVLGILFVNGIIDIVLLWILF